MNILQDMRLLENIDLFGCVSVYIVIILYGPGIENNKAISKF